MKKITLAVMAVLTVTAIHTTQAADVGRYNTKAALFGRVDEVTIGVLAGQTGAALDRAVARAIVDPSNYSSRKALLGTRAEATIAVLADTGVVQQVAPQPAVAPRTIPVDTYNSKKALL